MALISPDFSVYIYVLKILWGYYYKYSNIYNMIVIDSYNDLVHMVESLVRLVVVKICLKYERNSC